MDDVVLQRHRGTLGQWCARLGATVRPYGPPGGAAGRVRDVGVQGVARSPTARAGRQGGPARRLRRVVQRGRGQHDVLRPAVRDDGRILGRPGAPTRFRFLFKLPRTITHERRLRSADDEVREFFDLIAPLGHRAEQISVQLPASFGPQDLGALATFVRRLPSLGAAEHRIAVEVRHPAFFDGSVARSTLARILADAGAEWIVLDSTTLFAAPPTSEAERETWARKPRLPVHRKAVSGRPVVRFIGRDDPAATVEGWQAWIPTVAGVAGRRSHADGVRAHAGQRRCHPARPAVPRSGAGGRARARSAARPGAAARHAGEPVLSRHVDGAPSDPGPTTPPAASAATSSPL